MLIVRTNPISGEKISRELDVTQDEYNNWHHNRVVIQRAMPRLNPEEREFILTGLVGDEYEQVTKENEHD